MVKASRFWQHFTVVECAEILTLDMEGSDSFITNREHLAKYVFLLTTIIYPAKYLGADYM